MNEKMDKIYEAKKFEDRIYKKWEDSGYFNPDNLPFPEDAPTYSMVLPPPNITDKLHIGHASVIAIEDLFIRYHRLRGYKTLWLPGTDHAAIATQNVVEKKIFKESGQSRHDLGKEKFLKEVWNFLSETQSTILKQARKMGASIDWSRQAFTLDQARQKAVAKMFCDMYHEGIIYRGERIVNWCPRCKSTLADDELEYKEQKAILYTFKYDANFPITISTTRPETKLGDTAIAVHPKDQRYQKYIGQTLTANFCGQNLKIKVIADFNVEMDFGTGALGVTPAHSMIDYQMAIKNKLPSIKVINEEGKIHEGFAEFSGLSALEARDLIVKKLKENGLIISEEEIDNNLSICYRCDSAIEPLPSKQWFVSLDKKLDRLGGKSLKERATEVAQKKEIIFIPDRFTKRYLDWVENLHDWCISRQIWFGHQIPVWYKKNSEEIYVGEEAPLGEEWTQDPDTLDTWFSSAMWTFSTLGWPDNFKNGEKIGDLKKFHPTQILETGYEIITLWVSRMVIMSLFALNEIPFEKVYLNGMVLDKNGKKMSKSKGNGIDPIDVIEQFSTDALRLSLLIGNTPGNDMRMSEEKIESSRNFLNKLWNISRFIISDQENLSYDFDKNKLSLSDKWILNKLEKLVQETEDQMKDYKFSLVGESLKDFTWNDLADWYLEAKKFERDENYNKLLIYILKNILKLWHPFIPFITELIWEKLGEPELLMISSWPQIKINDFSQEQHDFEFIRELIISIRNARAENKIEANKKIKAFIISPKSELIKNNEHLIKNLKTGLEQIEIISQSNELPSGKNILITMGESEIYLIGAIDEEKEVLRIQKEIENLEKMIQFLKDKLNNKDFVNKAPQELVQKERERLEKSQNELEKLQQN